MKIPLLLLLTILVAASPAAEKARRVSSPALRVHPKVFEMIDCWISDSQAPVVTEINLDAVESNQNQFNLDEVKEDEGWVRRDNSETHGLVRYRVLGTEASHYKVESQQNGGGTLTTAAIIELAVEKRIITVDGKKREIRMLRVYSYKSR